MLWWEWAALVFFLLGFVAMGAVLAYRLYRNPLLLVGLLPTIWAYLKPAVIRYVLPLFLDRNEPSVEERMQECIRRGGEWDNFRKVCKEKR